MREELTKAEANALKWWAALRQVVNVLGPESICDCDDCQTSACQGLRAEAHEALRIAKEALNVDD